jgi:hypothetical protein
MIPKFSKLVRLLIISILVKYLQARLGKEENFKNSECHPYDKLLCMQLIM